MRRLDFHIHFNSDDPKQMDQLAAACRTQRTWACMSGGLRYGGHDMVPNEQVLAFCKGKYSDCFLPLAKVDLWDKADPDQIYRFADAGFKGLKCIYPYYEYDHDLYMPVYEAAEKCGLPVLFHTGNYRPSTSDLEFRRPMLKNMNPLNLDRIARSFQKLHIVMAHMGTSIWRHEAAEYVKIHANLYTDLAGCGAWQGVSADDLTKLMRPEIQRIDATYANFGKLVFGSDGYVTHPWIEANAQQHYDALCEMTGVPPEIRKKIMGGTVAGWMGIQLDED